MDSLIDIRCCWKVFWITANVDRILWLIYPNPVYPHRRWENKMLEVNVSKVI